MQHDINFSQCRYMLSIVIQVHYTVAITVDYDNPIDDIHQKICFYYFFFVIFCIQDYIDARSWSSVQENLTLG